MLGKKFKKQWLLFYVFPGPKKIKCPMFLDFTHENCFSTLVLHLYLLGEAGRRGAHHGPVGDSSIKHRMDWTNEAGLSRTDWAQEENPSLRYLFTPRSVGGDGLHQACLFPRSEFKVLAYQTDKYTFFCFVLFFA